jgi:hypothetical protein
LFETCLSAVKILEDVALLESSLEWLQHFGYDAPILITTNAAGDFCLLDANVSDDGNGSVVAPQVTKRGPFIIVLSQETRRQYENDEQGCE